MSSTWKLVAAALSIVATKIVHSSGTATSSTALQRLQHGGEDRQGFFYAAYLVRTICVLKMKCRAGQIGVDSCKYLLSHSFQSFGLEMRVSYPQTLTSVLVEGTFRSKLVICCARLT